MYDIVILKVSLRCSATETHLYQMRLRLSLSESESFSDSDSQTLHPTSMSVAEECKNLIQAIKSLYILSVKI